MATTKQLTEIQDLDIEKRSCASRQFANARRRSIVGQNEEAALVLAAKSGDGHAFEILIKRYQRTILAIARRFTRIREDAEDIVQQSFQKAFVHLHKFEGKSSFSTWLTRIAINEALMLLRRGRSLRELSINDLSGNEETALGLEIPDSRAGPESAFLQGERSRILSAAMDKLAQGIRKANELRELGECSTGGGNCTRYGSASPPGCPGNRSCGRAVRRMASRAINSSAVPAISAATRDPHRDSWQGGPRKTA